MFFLVLVVVPWLRGNRPLASAFLRETGERFRAVAWTCLGVLLVTGTFNLWIRGVRFADFASREWRASAFGQTVLWKLGAVGVVLLVSAYHDFFVGPRATTAEAGSIEAEALRRRASVLGRLNAALALFIVAAAVAIVRGQPW
jgi:hypothetical protein